MYKLTVKQLVMLNNKLNGGENKNLDPAKEAALKKIAAAPYEKDKFSHFIYDTLPEKAARMGCLIACEKPFASGNTRTAVLAILTFMEINGQKLEDYNEGLSSLAEFLEACDFCRTELWIKQHSFDVRKNADRDLRTGVMKI